MTATARILRQEAAEPAYHLAHLPTLVMLLPELCGYFQGSLQTMAVMSEEQWECSGCNRHDISSSSDNTITLML